MKAYRVVMTFPNEYLAGMAVFVVQNAIKICMGRDGKRFWEKFDTPEERAEREKDAKAMKKNRAKRAGQEAVGTVIRFDFTDDGLKAKEDNNATVAKDTDTAKHR